MTDEQLLSAIGEIRDEFVLEAAEQVSAHGVRPPLTRILKWGVAACLLLAIGVSAWRLTEPLGDNPIATSPNAVTETHKMNAAVDVTVPENVLDTPSYGCPPSIVFNGITYGYIGTNVSELGEKLGEMTLSDGTERVTVTVYSIKDIAAEDALALGLAGSDTTYRYESVPATLTD